MNKVLLSTDIGTDPDDALALLTILNSGINLQGIYTTNGNVNIRSYIAKHLINLSGKNIPIANGESASIENYIPPYLIGHEEDMVDYSFVDFKRSVGLKVFYKPLKKMGIISNGLEHLAKSLSREKSVIFSIAPLTNIAKLIQNYPNTIKNIEKLYIMGGRFNEENTPEHNIKFDPIAAEIVFDSNIPITMISGDLCDKYRLPRETLDKITSEHGKYVKHMAKANLAIKTSINLNYYIHELNSSLKFFIENTVGVPHELIVNLDDSYYAAIEGENYFKEFYHLINYLRENRLNHNFAAFTSFELEKLIPRSLSVADVYVPYCFLNPDRLKTKRANVKTIRNGTSYLEPGSKHEIVESIDFDHFKEFLRTHLK